MLNAGLGLVLFFVANPVESAKFYQKVLGIAPVELSPGFALFVLKNGVKLGLWLRTEVEPKVEAAIGAMEICFELDNVDAVYKQWCDLEVPMLQAPTEMDFGYTFVATDPDGHRIRVYKLNEDPV